LVKLNQIPQPRRTGDAANEERGAKSPKGEQPSIQEKSETRGAILQRGITLPKERKVHRGEVSCPTAKKGTN